MEEDSPSVFIPYNFVSRDLGILSFPLNIVNMCLQGSGWGEHLLDSDIQSWLRVLKPPPLNSP